MNFLIFGTIQGSIYALLAMGFSLVYGVGGILNQAHGAFYVIATYIFYWCFINIPQYGYIAGMFIGIIATAIVGGLIYLLLIKPLKESHVGVVIVTFAFAFFTEQLVGILVDSKYHNMPYLIPGQFNLLGVNIQYQYALIIIISLSLLALVTLIINKFKLGKSIRAVAQDSEAASLMGINVDRILAYTLIISAFLAAVAAILYVPVETVAPHIGWNVLLNSFAIVVLGGLGSLPGSVVGAFILAYARAFTNYFVDPVLSALIPIVVIVVVLIIRPRGLFGKKEID
jgi:branched-chain amino acid transport system permease protein